MGLGAFSRLLGGMGAVGLVGLLAGGALAADLTGRKGLGGSVGTSLMIGDSEFRAHARPRFTGDAMFKYGFRPQWAVVGFFGYGWNAYAYEERWLADSDFRRSLNLTPTDSQEKVVAMSPFTAGLEYRFGQDVWVPYVGAGGGLYLLQVLFDRSVGRDPRPRSLAKHRTFNFGLYGRVGLEQFLSDAVALDYEALGHVVFSKEREKFPPPNSADLRTYGYDFVAYGGDTQLIQVRMGLRYYWGEK
jgi:hypothetical protein